MRRVPSLQKPSESLLSGQLAGKLITSYELSLNNCCVKEKWLFRDPQNTPNSYLLLRTMRTLLKGTLVGPGSSHQSPAAI